MERLLIHGQTRIRKLNPSGRLIRIEVLLSGGYGIMDRVRRDKVKKDKMDPGLPGGPSQALYY